jgi:hypothetical protein
MSRVGTFYYKPVPLPIRHHRIAAMRSGEPVRCLAHGFVTAPADIRTP